jgi:hypothetical protein
LSPKYYARGWVGLMLSNDVTKCPEGLTTKQGFQGNLRDVFS